MARNTNRTKGHDAERLYARVFKKLGFSYCVTSRYGSRKHDDAGIDLINIPFNVQVKAGYKKGLNYSKVLNEISQRIKTMFLSDSPEQDQSTMIIHRKDVGRGKRRNSFDDLVVMSFKDFEKIIKKIDSWE